MFDGVEVGRVRGQEQESASCIFDEFLCSYGFVEPGVVHDDDHSRPARWQQVMLQPRVERIGIGVSLEPAGRVQF